MDHARARPLAVRAEADRADDGLHLVLVQVVGELPVVEALRRVDRLLEHLADRVVERRQVEAERVDLGLDRPLRIALQEILDAGILDAGHVRVVIDDAVQRRAERHHVGRELQPDHAAAEQLDRVADADLVYGAHDGHRVVRIGHDEHDVGPGGADGADHRREVDGRRRVVLVVNRLQPRLLGEHARPVCQVLRKFLVGGEKGDRLGAGLLADMDEAVGPARGVGPRRVVEPHVVLDRMVHLEREVAHQQQAALLDQRHDRRGGHSAVRRDEQIDLVDVEQLGVDPRRQRGVGLVVVNDELDPAAEQAALGIDVIDPHLQREQRRFSAGAQRAGLRHAHADLDGRRLRQRSRAECQSQYE